jgi:hypothetical protein
MGPDELGREIFVDSPNGDRAKTQVVFAPVRHQAPRRVSTAPMVFTRMYRSRPSDQFSM